MKVRSGIATIVALAVALLGLWAALASPVAAAASGVAESGDALTAGPSVTIAVLPAGTGPDEIAAASPDLAVGVLSAGLGRVPARQTYLDIGQGNRLAESLYPRELPAVPVGPDGVPAPEWAKVVARAAGAPAEIRPGLLADTLAAAGVPAGAAPAASYPALIAVGEGGRLKRRPGCEGGGCPGLTVVEADVDSLSALAGSLADGELLIAIERPGEEERLRSIGIAGDGFAGTLTSSSTRLDGYVLSTDVAPTVLAALEVPVPDEMDGREIESDAGGDRSDIAGLRSRLDEVTTRRAPVIGTNLLIWIGLLALAALIGRARAARVALPLAATALALLPALLLLGAALQPSLLVERLLIGAGAPALAALLLWGCGRRLPPDRARFAAFALAAAVALLLTAFDVLAGSPLTTLSLVGPSPGLGVRFFGIGNELEATIGCLLALGSGAAVTALAPADPRRAVAVTAAVAALAAVAVFAPGRFGADVGAAITFPAAAAGVVLAALGGSRNRIALVIAAPILALAALIAVDLALGGDAHLSRSVLDAGGLDGLGDVLERRIRLSAASFARFFDSIAYMLALAVIIAAVVARSRIRSWLQPYPAAAAGFVGAAAASVVGALANDSGATLLLIGTVIVAAFTGLVWSAQYFTSDSGDPSRQGRTHG
jgi:hypothetical protein